MEIGSITAEDDDNALPSIFRERGSNETEVPGLEASFDLSPGGKSATGESPTATPSSYCSSTHQELFFDPIKKSSSAALIMPELHHKVDSKVVDSIKKEASNNKIVLANLPKKKRKSLLDRISRRASKNCSTSINNNARSDSVVSSSVQSVGSRSRRSRLVKRLTRRRSSSKQATDSVSEINGLSSVSRKSLVGRISSRIMKGKKRPGTDVNEEVQESWLAAEGSESKELTLEEVQQSATTKQEKANADEEEHQDESIESDCFDKFFLPIQEQHDDPKTAEPARDSTHQLQKVANTKVAAATPVEDKSSKRPNANKAASRKSTANNSASPEINASKQLQLQLQVGEVAAADVQGKRAQQRPNANISRKTTAQKAAPPAFKTATSVDDKAAVGASIKDESAKQQDQPDTYYASFKTTANKSISPEIKASQCTLQDNAVIAAVKDKSVEQSHESAYRKTTAKKPFSPEIKASTTIDDKAAVRAIKDESVKQQPNQQIYRKATAKKSVSPEIKPSTTIDEKATCAATESPKSLVDTQDNKTAHEYAKIGVKSGQSSASALERSMVPSEKSTIPEHDCRTDSIAIFLFILFAALLASAVSHQMTQQL